MSALGRFLLLTLLLGSGTSGARAAPIHDAAKNGDITAITAALDAGADINASDGIATPLYFAIRSGHSEAAKLLIARGADVNAETNIGSALLAAVTKRNIEMIDLLLEKGANPNSVSRGSTVLHVAAKVSCLDCLKALVAAGADVNALTRDMESPLHLARRLGNPDMAAYLLAHGVVLPKPPPISALLAAADVEKGRTAFNTSCASCHHVEPDKGPKPGPNLWNTVGRDKASYPEFVYSDVMLGLEGVWTYEDLNTFLFAPMATTPGVAMHFPGVPEETGRADLIAYMRSLSDTPMPLP
jgi:cytochrome c